MDKQPLVDLIKNMDKQTLVDLIKCIYLKYPTGDDLHIVLDDLNVEDHHLLFCLDSVLNDPELVDSSDRTLFVHCIGYLLTFDEEERIPIIQKATCNNIYRKD